ncbi:hypothetical protein DY000_02039467 [Brassica cretica]|uniref:Uncharacterized protein n=1 Tax=Brassica cretica TaxID=69181 RepID=A0ABQ7B8P0_BRACR|nr:hypothetical protein DY000_02039467 [Brassica cretica]
MKGSPYRKFSISRRKESDPETEPRKLHSGELGFLLAGILGTGVPSSGDPEAGVLPRVWRNSIPEYFSPTDSTKDTKVDQPVNYSHLLRLFEGTKPDLQH